ncbi:hypothetical protein Back11_01890 [Paenibacillus baekrokdamisoli]|uniref:Uncharacterized protein n=1 Tax=Paenibacillus baekrokdamisoli TaxID=1712516 RepID=A0A3G9J658_9BACL|nr:hypothetical protein [Paenibacillus baekrokdamisoli]MBB3069182.1 hypothetical protein [Paenibacillus baekrokdamisoli]BBH18844.1 hypothetical protein Back11_01890 [Paenibacillus baekrokdamisoli]
MFKSKFGFALISMLLVVMVVLSGCTKPDSPKETLQASMTKASEIKSYHFQGSMKFEDFNLTGESAAQSADMLNSLKNAELSWTGAYQASPMTMEMTLKLSLPGDMAISFSIPMFITQDKAWVKIPSIPMLPIPADLTGKYLELDLKKLAEQSGQPLPTISTVDIGQSQQLMNDISAIVYKHIDENTYLTSVKVKDAGLPEGTNVKQVVQFHLEKDQLEPLFNSVVKQIAPEVIKLLSDNEKYQKLMSLKPEDLTKAKAELEKVTDKEIADGMAEMKKDLTSLNIVSNIGLDGDDYPVYTDASIKAAMKVDGNAGSLSLKMVSQTTNINEKVTFEGKPKAEEIITMEQLEAQLGGMFGGTDMGMEDTGTNQ